MNFPGAFFVFCGLDGSGKTTQARLMAERLEEVMFSTCITSEPTSWYLSDPFVQYYFAQDHMDEHGLAALALFSAADRARHLSEVILPQLKAGKVVISSRYVYSAYAYFPERGLNDQTWLKIINRNAIEPDLTFFLDIDPEVALQHIIERGDTAKKEELDLMRLQKIRQHFLSFRSDKFHILNAHQDKDRLHEDVISRVLPIVQKRQREYKIAPTTPHKPKV